MGKRKLSIGSTRTMPFSTFNRLREASVPTYVEVKKGLKREKVLYQIIDDSRFFGEGGTFVGYIYSLWYNSFYKYDKQIDFSLHLYSPNSFDEIEEFDSWKTAWE